MSLRDAPSTLLVDRLRRYGDLSAYDIAALHALSFQVRTVRCRDVLVHEGHVPDHCTLLLSGIAARERTTRLGARQFLNFFGAGDFVDLGAGLMGRAPDTVQVFGDAQVAYLALDAILRLAFDRPAIGRLLWIDTVREASIAHEWTVNIGRRDARTRLLHLVCELAVRQEQAGLGDRHELVLALTQEQIGDALALTAVHVNRTLQSLRSEPAIERDGRTIRIRDWRKVARLADFDESYLYAPRLGTIGQARDPEAGRERLDPGASRFAPDEKTVTGPR